MDDDDLKPAPRKETGTLLFLSLFLLLLAFFILLNSLATFRETKTRAVMTSVSATFQTEEVSDISAELLVSTLGQVPEPEAVLDEVERLWRTAVPIAEVEVVSPGRDMMIEMPVTQLFVGAEARVRGDRQALLDATATALSARLEGLVVEMQALIFVADLSADPRPAAGSGASGGAAAPAETADLADPGAELQPRTAMEGMPLAAARADALARAFVDRGAPPDGLQVGLRAGDPRRVRLRFFVRDAGRNRLSFAPDGETVGEAAAGAGEGGGEGGTDAAPGGAAGGG